LCVILEFLAFVLTKHKNHFTLKRFFFYIVDMFTKHPWLNAATPLMKMGARGFKRCSSIPILMNNHGRVQYVTYFGGSTLSQNCKASICAQPPVGPFA
jgi:hypothetical protein